MSFNDLIVYFAHTNGRYDRPFDSIQFDDQGVSGLYRNLRLYSVFQALFSSTTLEPVAHEALLRVRDTDGLSISPEQAFRVADSPEEVVYFDRLCRVLHSLNFFNQSDARGDLFLNVSGRHLLGVGSGHGHTFETLLGHCGLKPKQIVLEVLEHDVEDLGRLQMAVDGYRSRGFRVAIDDFGSQNSNFDRLWRLIPDIVKIDRSLLVQANVNPRARKILPKLVEIIHDLGAQVVCEGIETPEQHALAIDSGVDLLQGYFYARPATEVVVANSRKAGEPLANRRDVLSPVS